MVDSLTALMTLPTWSKHPASLAVFTDWVAIFGLCNCRAYDLYYDESWLVRHTHFVDLERFLLVQCYEYDILESPAFISEDSDKI